MDPVSAGVGLIASILSLVEAARALHKSIRRLRTNTQHRNQLQALVNGLIETLESAGSVSDAASTYTLASLQELKSMFESLEKGPCPRYPKLVNSIWRCVTAADINSTLKEAGQKLENLRREVVVVEGMLQLQKQIPIVCNERVELPPLHVGLDRSKAIIEFLQESQSQELRVIGIHGLPGVGKTTLLNFIWQEASSKAPFAVRAYVQIGHDATLQSLCSLQSSMLQQLGGGNKEFPSDDIGRGMLSEHFQKLRSNNKPVFLAIDNVFEAEDLQKLLPSKLSRDLLPAFSGIALTCRDSRVVKALLNICHLQEGNSSQVFRIIPSCLDADESKRVFVECANMHADEHVDLLNALVPLCGGLPLALTVLGKIFVDEAKRERSEWEAIQRQMEELDRDDQETSPIMKSLQLSYDKLKPTRKAAFLDVVNFFYGWRWETVERIVGANVLKDLQNSSLILETEYWTKCNQSGLRAGFDYDIYTYLGQCEPSTNRVVSMHDLTLRFGESLHAHSNDTIKDLVNVGNLGDYGFIDASKLRNLMLLKPGNLAKDSQLEFLRRATNLQMLCLCEGASLTLLQAGGKDSEASPLFPGRRHLRYLRLHWWDSSRLIMEMMLSREMREIHLENCDDIVQLPDTPLQKLERLKISSCRNFQGFSKSCVMEWCSLKDLEVLSCGNILEIPAELGSLGSLRVIMFEHCQSLQDFPSLCNSNGPHHLLLKDCPSLKTLQAISCPLRRLQLHRVPATSLVIKEAACVFLQVVSLVRCELEVLPSSICNASSLQALELSYCNKLKQLPEEIGKLQALTVLGIKDCKEIERVPTGIGNLQSLQTLEVRFCENLLELPSEIGRLTSLTKLDICWCEKLMGLPRSIGNAWSLQELVVSECNNFVELPDEIGRLTSLSKLDVSGCKKLKMLPAAVCKARALKCLHAGSCQIEELELLDSLIELRIHDYAGRELPKGFSNLKQLQVLSIENCVALLELPEELGNLTSLRELWIAGCKNVWKLEGIGNLSSLIKLTIIGCQEVERMPEGLCNAAVLRELRLIGCWSLLELPGELGKLSSLIELELKECRSLEKLPNSICNISSLESLSIKNCASLRVLPEELGNLSSLGLLQVYNCTKLEKLPDSICRILSLHTLDITGCESLVELPRRLGSLPSLTWLTARYCRKLEELPNSICYAPSLKDMWFKECQSLKELPEDLAKLKCLKCLDVRGCTLLRQLPASLRHKPNLRLYHDDL